MFLHGEPATRRSDLLAIVDQVPLPTEVRDFLERLAQEEDKRPEDKKPTCACNHERA